MQNHLQLHNLEHEHRLRQAEQIQQAEAIESANAQEREQAVRNALGNMLIEIGQRIQEQPINQSRLSSNVS
jgi:hypothetical protein